MSGESLDNSSNFHINRAYADKYNRWREKEELQKLKDKYGDKPDMVSSSSSESEDEDAEALTNQLENDWLSTLAAIKNKDPKIYDSSFQFYNETDAGEVTNGLKNKTKDKPMFLKDYERKVILEKGGIISESEDDSTQFMHGPSYYEEQDEILKSFKAVGDDLDNEDVFTPRKKNQEEQEREDKDYLQWLKVQKQPEVDGKAGIELAPSKKHLMNHALEDEEKFLRDYILGKKYLDVDDDRIPTYDEIVQDEDISEDERDIEKQEQFERKYNFRFEDPDPEFIKSYPRLIENSVRRKKDKRVQKRQEDKDRKRKEKERKMEDLKQMKNLKKKQIMRKLEKIKEATGQSEVNLTEKDINDDFDPAEHDRLMKAMFDDDYYMDVEEAKPVFSDAEESEAEEECWDEWPCTSTDHKEMDKVQQVDEEEDNTDFNMDADHVAVGPKTKRKKKSKLAEALLKKKPVFNPDETSFEEYFDEYYSLNYEDIIGDQPSRFKYRKVKANDFGLDVAEVLTCPDRELNAWVSVKKMSQYRTEEEEEFDHRLFKKKSKQPQKLHVLSSLSAHKDEEKKEADSMVSSKKRKRKRKRKMGQVDDAQPQASHHEIITEHHGECQNIGVDSSTNNFQTVEGQHSEKIVETLSERSVKTSGESHKVDDAENKQKRKSQKEHVRLMDSKPSSQIQSTGKKSKLNSRSFHMSDARLKAYGIDPRKFKHTYGKKIRKEQHQKNNIS